MFGTSLKIIRYVYLCVVYIELSCIHGQNNFMAKQFQHLKKFSKLFPTTVCANS